MEYQNNKNKFQKEMINLMVKIPDTPGSLIELINPISKNGGNIFAVLHHHDKKTDDMIPVSISFELPEELHETSLRNIKKELQEKRIQIDNIILGAEKQQITVILSGHVFDTDVLDTIDRLASKGIKVSELQAVFTEMKEISNVKMKFNISESMTKKKVFKELNEICKEKNLILIRS
jgi:ACT domain-containing protein